MHVKRSVALVVSLILALVSAASAATLELREKGGGTTVLGQVGDTFILELVATVDSPEAKLSLGLDVRLLGGGAASWVGATQVGLTSTVPPGVTLPWPPGATVPWTEFAPICSGSDPCVAVNQANPVILPSGLQPDAFSGVIATITGAVQNDGTVTVAVQDFFGASTTDTVTVTIAGGIPEPATGGLLALGLLGLAGGARHPRGEPREPGGSCSSVWRSPSRALPRQPRSSSVWSARRRPRAARTP